MTSPSNDSSDRDESQFLLPAFTIAGLVIFAVTLHFSAFLTTGASEPIRVIVTIFAILTGFILAIITIAGDPGRLYLGSWRIASAHSRQIKRVLFRYRILFYVYLATMLLAFATTVAQSVKPGGLTADWLERFTISIGAAAFWWSIGLPGAHVKAQISRLDQEIDRREKDAQKSRLALMDEDDRAFAADMG